MNNPSRVSGATIGAIVGACLGAWYYHDQRATYETCVARGLEPCVLAVVGGTLGTVGLIVSGLWVAVVVALAYG